MNVNVNTTSAFLSKVFDVGDLLALTFSNCALKTRVIEWPVKLCVLFKRFLRFFLKFKKHDFLRFFELLHTFSQTLLQTTSSIFNVLYLLSSRQGTQMAINTFHQ